MAGAAEPASSPLVSNPTPILFFTGKGGVGKTSIACTTAIQLADAGHRVLLICTDPASNLDEVLETKLSSEPQEIPGVSRLFALNIDPEVAAREYRERAVGPYRNLLPASAIRSIEEQLSGACTVEIAAFEEFSQFLGDATWSDKYDFLVFDTAPTGHTLRLLELPAAWNNFIHDNVGGTSCLGPLSALKEQRQLFAHAEAALKDPAQTTLVLVARPERSSLLEAERSRKELGKVGLVNVRLILNGVFRDRESADPIAQEMSRRTAETLAEMPKGLSDLPKVEVPLVPFPLLSVNSFRRLTSKRSLDVQSEEAESRSASRSESLAELIDELESAGAGVVMTMGKGGVGKTSVAARIAAELAAKGCAVTLTTTDPAAHVEAAVGALNLPAFDLRVTRIDPRIETENYTREVLTAAGSGLDAAGLALLEEDLRSPCTEEIAVFRAFARTVAEGTERIVIIDTAPTGHTLLLLDAAESYHREVLKKPSGNPEAVRQLLPRLRDPAFTRIVIVTLPESTPVHEAMKLEQDLRRAGLSPWGWVINQSLTPLRLAHPTLRARQAFQRRVEDEVYQHAARTLSLPWSPLSQQTLG